MNVCFNRGEIHCLAVLLDFKNTELRHMGEVGQKCAVMRELF